MPTAEQVKLVETMAGMGIPQPDICKVILGANGKPIAEKTLRLYFREVLDTGELKANAKVAGALFNNAIGGNVAAQIFWLKTRARWKETQTVEHTGADGKPLYTPTLADFYDMAESANGSIGKADQDQAEKDEA